MTVSVVFAIAGVIALLFGIIGGGIKAKEIEVPKLPSRARFVTIVVGVTLISITIWLENNPDNVAIPVSTLLPETAILSTSPSLAAHDGDVLTMARNWPTIVFNDFQDNAGDWWTGNDGPGNWEVTRGKYVWTYPENGSYTWWRWIKVPLGTEFYLAVTANIISGPTDSQFSLMFRRVDENHYLFTVKNDGYFRIIYFLDEEFYSIMDWTPSSAINESQPNKLEVIADNAHYWFAINNVLVAEIDDMRLSGGIAGLHFSSSTGDKQAIIEFDNYEHRER